MARGTVKTTHARIVWLYPQIMDKSMRALVLFLILTTTSYAQSDFGRMRMVAAAEEQAKAAKEQARALEDQARTLEDMRFDRDQLK